MSSSSNNDRKTSHVVQFEKPKPTVKHNEVKTETHDKPKVPERKNTLKKSDIPVFMNTHRKSDAEKSIHNDTHEKEPYVREYKEFAGVTIIIRTAPNPRAFGSLEAQGKVGMHANRRKSEFQHSFFNIQERFDHGDKSDDTGTSGSLLLPKTDTSANNSNDTQNTDN